jgi:hypothetical protein
MSGGEVTQLQAPEMPAQPMLADTRHAAQSARRPPAGRRSETDPLGPTRRHAVLAILSSAPFAASQVGKVKPSNADGATDAVVLGFGTAHKVM